MTLRINEVPKDAILAKDTGFYVSSDNPGTTEYVAKLLTREFHEWGAAGLADFIADGAGGWGVQIHIGPENFAWADSQALAGAAQIRGWISEAKNMKSAKHWVDDMATFGAWTGKSTAVTKEERTELLNETASRLWDSTRDPLMAEWQRTGRREDVEAYARETGFELPELAWPRAEDFVRVGDKAELCVAGSDAKKAAQDLKAALADSAAAYDAAVQRLREGGYVVVSSPMFDDTVELARGFGRGITSL